MRCSGVAGGVVGEGSPVGKKGLLEQAVREAADLGKSRKGRSRASKIFEPRRKGRRPDTYTLEGYPAFTEPTFRQSLCRTMLAGICKNQYYASADVQASEALSVIGRAAEEDPKFLLKAALMSRRLNMKLIVKLAITALSGRADFCREHEGVIVGLLKSFHPGQLFEYLELQKKAIFGKGLGYRQQRWIREVINSWGYDTMEYYSLKYKRQLNLLLRLTHPAPRRLWDYVIYDRVAGERQKALEDLKSKFISGSVAPEEFSRIITENDIPWDAVKSFVGKDPLCWYAMAMQMGTQALLLNTRSLFKHGVFDISGASAFYEDRLKPSSLEKARINPLDTAKAYMMVRSSGDWLQETLKNAIADSFLIPIPGFKDKRVAVSIDISGSMKNAPLLMAGVLAAAFIYNSTDPWITAFNRVLVEEGQTYDSMCGICTFPLFKKIKNRPRELVGRILALGSGGSTDTSCFLNEALRKRRIFDYMVIVTDEMQNTGSHLFDVWREYRRLVNSKAFLIVVNPTNYPWRNVDQGDSSIIVFHTMTPLIFRALDVLGNNVEEQVEAVELVS